MRVLEKFDAYGTVEIDLQKTYSEKTQILAKTDINRIEKIILKMTL